MLLEGIHLLLVNLGLLELEIVRSLCHKVPVMLYHFICPTFQEAHDFLYLGIVLLDRDFADTAAGTSVDMEVQTWPEFAAQHTV